ncbi:hypothetical protein CJU90_4293 [Yarrowia sp. C11]|nr:hypothetical protein CJU90_4293 [Yarrowia sp. C11]
MQVSIRFLVSAEEANLVLAKKGALVRRLESSLDVRLSLSSYKGSADRVLYITGTPENSSRAVGALVRVWSDDTTSFTVRMLIPEPLMIKVVGFRGTALQRLHLKSGAQMDAQKSRLPGSTDRLLVASGVADALHRAVYFTALIFEDYKFLLRRKHASLTNYVPAGKAVEEKKVIEEEKENTVEKDDLQKMVVIVCDSDYLDKLKNSGLKVDMGKVQILENRMTVSSRS